MACHPASQAAIAQPPPLPYQDNELHLGPLYELTLRTFSAAKRGPCASDGQRECDTGPGCGARTAENRKKKKKKTTKHSVAQQQHHSFKKFLKCLLWDFTILQENCCKYDLIRQNSISLDCHAII